MTSSSSESATAELWSRREPGVPGPAFAAALLGLPRDVLADAAALALAGSPEAEALIEGMEVRIRTLGSGVDSTPQRYEFSVRGPVLWAETLTARANSFGNEDVFVCATARRSFDTVENRVLVAALDSIASAGRSMRGPLGPHVPPDDAARIETVAAAASRWRRHPRLASLRAGRLSGRDRARLRGGHRLVRMAPVLAVRERAAEPFGNAHIELLADGATRALHRTLLLVLEAAERRGWCPGTLGLVDGSLVSAGLRFRHPRDAEQDEVGLSYRGVPLLPAIVDLVGAEWLTHLPSRGITVSSAEEAERLMQRLDARATTAQRSAGEGAQAPSGQTSSSSST